LYVVESQHNLSHLAVFSIEVITVSLDKFSFEKISHPVMVGTSVTSNISDIGIDKA